jgi:hypothetical protein
LTRRALVVYTPLGDGFTLAFIDRAPTGQESGGERSITKDSEVQMTRARSVLLILILLAGSLSPTGLRAQLTQGSRAPVEGTRHFVLEQNYPEQANPETWIPFTLDSALFQGSPQVTATIRIFNILSQVVAIPEAIDHPAGRGARVINLPYTEPGRKIAYWDGRDTAGRQVPSGVYYMQMVVGEETQTRKLIVLNPRRRRTIFPW